MLLARLVTGRYGPPLEERPYAGPASPSRPTWLSRVWALLLGRRI